MERGPYRAEQALDAALPWARHNLLPWSIAVVVAAAIAVAGPLVALESRGLLFTILLCAVPVLLAVAGILVARGRKVPAAPLLVGSIGTYVVSAVQSAGRAGPLPSALELGVPEDTVRIAADAFARIEHGDLQGAIGTAAACLVVAVAAIGAIGTVDRERASAAPGPVWTTLLLGAGWFVLGFSVRVAFRPSFGAMVFLTTSLVAPLVAIGLAALATWMIGVLDKSGDAQEVASTLVCLAVAAVASTILVLALDRASIAAITGTALRDAATAMTPEQRYAIVAPLAEARSAHAWASLVDLVGALACFAIPIVAARRALGKSWMKHVRVAVPMLGMVGGVVVILAFVTILETSVVRAARGAIVIVDPAPLPTERTIEVPKVHKAGPSGPPAECRLVVTAGSDAPLPLAGADVVVDRRVPFAQFMQRALRSTQPNDTFSFVAQPVLRPNVERIADLAAFVGPFERRIPMSYSLAQSIDRSRPVSVTLDEAPFVLVASATSYVQLAIQGDETRRTDDLAALEIPHDPQVEIIARPFDTMERVITIAAALRSDLVEMGLLAPTRPLFIQFVREQRPPPRPTPRRR